METESEPLYYTVSEAADLIGVSDETISNWVSRGLLRGNRQDDSVVIPRAELDDYKPLAEAAKGLDPLPELNEVIESIREGRRRFIWPIEIGKEQDQPL